MQDSELKKLLLETCPVRPGQEERAWASLRGRMFAPSAPRTMWNWLYYPTWRGLAVGAAALMLVSVTGSYLVVGFRPISFATADSQSPGIYATAFYSRPAQAQVIWLNGMGPATDQPTYLDPTTTKANKKPARLPLGDPNSL
jgi:hypothetical protein